MTQPVLMLVGGFLGAGKTTLLGQASRHLIRRGMRLGLITNDQAEQLVDTGMLAAAGLTVAEIAGGCFCCRFDDLVSAADRLLAAEHPDILLGEPVGSCTDLSATVLQPMKELCAERFRVAPFSVLVDPYRLQEVLEPRLKSPLHASARYILRKQLEEADLLVLNKIDLLTPAELDELRAMLTEQFPAIPVFTISALQDRGIDAWLDAVLAGGTAGQRITEVDYDIYAEGEAVLGWLNATVKLTAHAPVDWRTFSLRMLEALQRRVQDADGEIAHVKLMLTTITGHYVANLTGTAGVPALRGAMSGSPRMAELILNARVEMSPEQLQALADESLREAAGERVSFEILTQRSLSPGRPQPVHRYAGVV